MYDFEKTIEKYYQISNKPNNRFLSWEHCYEYFYTNRQNIDYDKASLMLFCYLASWGMLRNSFLMNYDYQIHINLIKTLTSEYYQLWDCNEDFWELIHEADHFITHYYQKYKENNKFLSDTLRTKILLGIFGCTPAYDRFFKNGISIYNNNKESKLIKIFNKNSYRQLWDFYKKQKILNFKKLHQNQNILYPPMKLIDMYFWQIGYEKNKNKT